MKRFGGILSLMLAFLMSITMTSAANKKGTMTVNVCVSDVKFQIYYVGKLSDDGSQITYSDDFKDSDITWDLQNAATALSQYASLENITPVQEKTSANNKVVFDDLPLGVYLITGDTLRTDEEIIEQTPTLISMPQVENEEPVWNFAIEPKAENRIKLQKLSVVKVWKNDTKKVRPSSITVTLYRDKEAVEKVQLTQDNNYSYSWKGLDPDVVYTVDETNVPKNYTKSITKQYEEIIITNTYKKPPHNDHPKRIPQTGQMWWPVMALACCGFLFIIIHFLRNEKA